MSLYGLDADSNTVYQESPATEEEQLALQRFILQKVTHHVNLDTQDYHDFLGAKATLWRR